MGLPGQPTTVEARQPNNASLWKHRAFLTYWSGTVLNGLGSQVTFLALPLTAVYLLHADSAQMGLLRATASLPNLLLGLLAGVLVDRVSRRRTLIVASLLSSAVVVTVPLTALLHALSLAQVYAVSFLGSVFALFAALAANAYLPTLVGRGALVDANSKLATTNATVGLAGPSFAGLLVQLVTAPVAIVADACLTVGASLIFWLIRRDEPARTRSKARLLPEIAEGIRVVFSHRILRLLLVIVGSFNLFSAVAQAVFVLYIARGLGLPAVAIGFVFGASGVGLLVGALVAKQISSAIGIGPAIVAGGLTFGTGWALAPLATGTQGTEVLMLIASQFLNFGGAQLANVNLASLRQAVIPDRLMGRVGGSLSLVFQGVVPVGAVTGGLLGQHLGLRPTLLIAAAGTLLAMAIIAASPLRTVRTVEQAGAIA